MAKETDAGSVYMKIMSGSQPSQAKPSQNKCRTCLLLSVDAPHERTAEALRTGEQPCNGVGKSQEGDIGHSSNSKSLLAFVMSSVFAFVS